MELRVIAEFAAGIERSGFLRNGELQVGPIFRMSISPFYRELGRFRYLVALNWKRGNRPATCISAFCPF